MKQGMKQVRLLESSFDPLEVHGLFAVSSRSPAYPDSLVAIERGIAKIVGEHSLEDGTLVRVLQFGARPNREEFDEMRTVTLGPEFFQAPLKEYQEWPVKWWREVIQNSVDAGCTKMTLGTHRNEDGTVTVYAQDNGAGMDRETLLDKFLVFGATTKVGASGKTGGFGKAKELILMPWLSWKVHTRDTIASGINQQYKVSTGARIPGTRVEVVMPADGYATILAAREYLGRCHIPNVTFECVDEEYPDNSATIRPKSDVSKMSLIEESPRFLAYFQEKKDQKSTYYAFVRANGLYMFSVYVGNLPGQLYIELQGSTLDILHSNRDSFRDTSVQRDIGRLQERIAKDTASALKSKKGHVKKSWSTGHKFRADLVAPLSFLDQRALSPSTGSVEKMELSVDALDKILEGFNEIPEVRNADSQEREAKEQLHREQLQQLAFGGDRDLENSLKQLAWEPDFVLVSEVDNFKVPPRFLPETMTPRVKRLLRVWVETCRWVLMQLHCGEPYSVGFVFSPSLAAAFMRENNENWLLLNPFAAHKATKLLKSIHNDWDKQADVQRDLLDLTLQVTQKDQFQYIYALAVHECTHFADDLDYHDETFTSAMTFNFARCADGMKQYKRILEVTKERDAERPKQKKRSGYPTKFRVGDGVSFWAKRGVEGTVVSVDTTLAEGAYGPVVYDVRYLDDSMDHCGEDELEPFVDYLERELSEAPKRESFRRDWEVSKPKPSDLMTTEERQLVAQLEAQGNFDLAQQIRDAVLAERGSL